MTVDGLADFLAARYDEAEALVRAVLWADDEHGITWTASPSYNGTWWCVNDGYDEGVATVQSSAAPIEELARYIAAVDPAHRLADIKLKRAILAAYQAEHDSGFAGSGFTEGLEFAVRQLGAEFNGHPGYRAEWRPEA